MDLLPSSHCAEFQTVALDVSLMQESLSILSRASCCHARPDLLATVWWKDQCRRSPLRAMPWCSAGGELRAHVHPAAPAGAAGKAPVRQASPRVRFGAGANLPRRRIAVRYWEFCWCRCCMTFSASGVSMLTSSFSFWRISSNICS